MDYPTHRLDPNELAVPLYAEEEPELPPIGTPAHRRSPIEVESRLSGSQYDEEPELPPIGTPVTPRTVPVREVDEETGWGSVVGNLTGTILTILMLGG